MIDLNYSPTTAARLSRSRPGRAALLVSALALVLTGAPAAHAQYIYRINCGGGASGPLAADQYFSGADSFALTNPWASIDRTAVSAPLSDDAYKDVRVGDTTYTFPNLVPGKYYRVRLHLFEVWNIDTRTQNVTINGASYSQQFDIGGTNRVAVQDFTVAANTAGQIVVSLTGGNNLPMISAIEVLDCQVYFVATNGNNNWAGTLAAANTGRTNGPFATVAKARDTIRALKTGGQFNKPVTVFLRGGTYYQSQALEFTPQDSGSGTNRIVYEAYPGETPMISGGRLLTGWKNSTINGKSAWKITISDVATGAYYFRSLWVNNARRQRARMPDTGFFSGTSAVAGDINDFWNPPKRFVYSGTDIANWPDAANAEITYLSLWENSHCPIQSVDVANKTVNLTKYILRGVRDSGHYYVENTAAAADQPGEWYLKKSTGELYYIPKSGETTANTTLVAPRLINLVSFNANVDGGEQITDLVFRKINFAHTEYWYPTVYYGPLAGPYNLETWAGGQSEWNAMSGGIRALGLRYSSFDRCTFRNMSDYAVTMEIGSRYNRFDGNQVSDVTGGFRIGSATDTSDGNREVRDNILSDNTITDGGYLFHAANPIFIGQSGNNLITHNTISDFNYSGINSGYTFGFTDPSKAYNNRIAYNDIHHMGQNRNYSPNTPVMDDLGGIYLLGPQPGTVVDNNRVAYATCYDSPAFGIYLDNASADITVKNNISYRNKTANLMDHFSKNILVENNIFAFAGKSQLELTTDGMTGTERPNQATVRKNIVYYAGGGFFATPDMIPNQDFVGAQFNLAFTINSNLYWNVNNNGYYAGWRSIFSPDWQGLGFDTTTIARDPLFVNPSLDDFRLQSGTPATTIGFDPSAIKYYYGARY